MLEARPSNSKPLAKMGPWPLAQLDCAPLSALQKAEFAVHGLQRAKAKQNGWLKDGPAIREEKMVASEKHTQTDSVIPLALRMDKGTQTTEPGTIYYVF